MKLVICWICGLFLFCSVVSAQAAEELNFKIMLSTYSDGKLTQIETGRLVVTVNGAAYGVYEVTSGGRLDFTIPRDQIAQWILSVPGLADRSFQSEVTDGILKIYNQDRADRGVAYYELDGGGYALEYYQETLYITNQGDINGPILGDLKQGQRLDAAERPNLVSAPTKSSLTDGLQAYWSFDDYTPGDSSVNDDSGHAHFLTTSRGIPGSEDGMSGKAARFSLDGGRFFNTSGAGFGYDQLTTTMWVKHINRNPEQWWTEGVPWPEEAELLLYLGCGVGYKIENSHQTYLLGPKNNFGWQGYNLQLEQLGVWTFLTMTYDNGLFTTYKNATEPVTVEQPIVASDEYAILGGFSDHNQYDGLMDEVRIYNRVLSQAEINLLYAAPQGEVPPGGPEDNFGGIIDPAIVVAGVVNNVTDLPSPDIISAEFNQTRREGIPYLDNRVIPFSEGSDSDPAAGLLPGASGVPGVVFQWVYAGDRAPSKIFLPLGESGELAEGVTVQSLFETVNGVPMMVILRFFPAEFLIGLAPGTHTLEYWLEDREGNKSNLRQEKVVIE